MLACGRHTLAPDFLRVEAGLPSSSVKTTLGEKTDGAWPLRWSEGDCLLLNGVPSSALSSAEAGASTATFRFSGVGQPAVWDYTYCGLAGSDGTVVFSSSQNSREGNIAGNSLPMYASALSAVSRVTLRPLGAVLRFSFTSEEACSLSQIQLKALGGEPVCGHFTIGKDGSGQLDGTLTAAGNNRDNLLVSVDAALSNSPRAVCLVVPAGTYSAGFYAQIIASDGNLMEVWFHTRDNKNLSAGVLYDFGVSAFVPTGSSMLTLVCAESFTVDTIQY